MNLTQWYSGWQWHSTLLVNFKDPSLSKGKWMMIFHQIVLLTGFHPFLSYSSELETKFWNPRLDVNGNLISVRIIFVRTPCRNSSGISEKKKLWWLRRGHFLKYLLKLLVEFSLDLWFSKWFYEVTLMIWDFLLMKDISKTFGKEKKCDIECKLYKLFWW